MRIGLVSPYSFDVPGGVQSHVRDLAEELIRLGHDVSVLAPADDDDALPAYVVPAGRAVPVPYNGSVARLSFGLLSASRVRRWIREGEFDVLHVHEPASPSLGLLACWAAIGPIVATFHASMEKSRAITAAYAILQTALEKVSARIAVSERARETLVEHLGRGIGLGARLGSVAGQAVHERDQASGVLERRLGVQRPYLDRAQARMWAQLPPKPRVVGHVRGTRQQPRAGAEIREVTHRARHTRTRPAAYRHLPGGRQTSIATMAKRRVRGQRLQQRQMAS